MQSVFATKKGKNEHFYKKLKNLVSPCKQRVCGVLFELVNLVRRLDSLRIGLTPKTSMPITPRLTPPAESDVGEGAFDVLQKKQMVRPSAFLLDKMLLGWYNLLVTQLLGDDKMQKQGFMKITYIIASLLLALVCMVGCFEIDYGSPSSESGSSSRIDIFANEHKTSSKPATSSKTTTSDKTEVSSKAQTSSEKINFYNSGVLAPDETSSEREIIFYNSGVTVEDENDENDGRIVYDTPTGKKYHFDKDCAGKNATEALYDEIKTRKEPCKICAKE